MVDVEIDVTQLERRLAPLGVAGVRPLAGGASSLSFVAAAARGPVVVKVAPPGLEPVRNRDVLRQARVLRALAGTGVPVPEVLAEDAGDPPAVPPLFVMAFVEGSSVEPLFDRDGGDRDGDDLGGDEPPVVAERLRNAARALAALHALDPHAVGLGAEPVVGPADEVERWARALDTVDPALAPGWPDVTDALRTAPPAPRPPAIVHGDFRLGNMLAAGPTIAAIVDWEIWSVGDPRVDLGWFLVNADPETYRRPTRYAGALPAPEELAALYGGAPDLAWFRALACFKSTATWALIVKHNRRRAEPDPELEAMAAALPRLLDRARAFLSGGGGRP